ncbi:MAG: ATP synthase F1 subunit gamma [Gemmataceae bacterium]|nr:ATP synthase F1 subunit gamma [Gemmataceae bacterium]
MASTRALVKRRKAIRNIRKITRTMELIATARFKKAMDRAIEAEAFTRKIAELAADLSANAANVKHPLLERREPVRRSLLLVICSNRGLCGGYNSAIMREAAAAIRKVLPQGATLAQNLHLELSGKRVISWCRYQGYPFEASYTQFEDKPQFAEIEVIANKYIQFYTAGKVDRVDVAYSKFINAARQMPVVETLLPLSAVPGQGDGTPARSASEGTIKRQIEYEFMPSAAEILEELLPVSFKIRLFKCFLDAGVSEQIARRVAMKAATENAGEMIKNLTQKYNRARQAQITKEIAEVIGGAEALK